MDLLLCLLKIGGRRPGAGDIVLRPPANEVRVALASRAKASQRCWLRQHASWRHLALRARRRWRGRCAPPTPAASLISVSRYALGTRRTALRAEGAARLCAGRHSRWLRSPPRATRSAPMAWARCAPGRLRQPGRGLALRARRRWRGRRAPGRLHVPPPITRALPLSGGDVEDVVRFALLESSVQGARFALLPRARVGRGVSDIIMHECAGER